MTSEIAAMQQSDPITALVYNGSIRRVEVEGKTYYSLVDFVGVFADSEQDARQYWNDIKKAMVKQDGFEVSENIRRFKLLAKDGKLRATDCGEIVTIRRVLMSIHSEKAEPLRMWIAGRKHDALLNYDHRNVIEGRAWAADTIHLEMSTLELPEPESAYAEMGYRR